MRFEEKKQITNKTQMKAIREKLINDEGSSFKFLHLVNINDIAPYHYHPEYEITLHLGKARRFVGNNISDFQEIDLVLLGSNLPHCWAVEGDSEFYVVQFSENSFGTGFFDLPEMHTIRSLLQQSEKGISFSKTETLRFKEQLIALKQKQGANRLLHLFHLLENMAKCTSLQQISQVTYQVEGHNTQFGRVQKVFDYVHLHFKDKIEVQQAATLVHMKTTAFCNYFKRYTNKRFSDFVNETRIGYASRLLVETDMQVAQIAYESGYNSLSNFNKQFKKINLLSPKKYRKLARQS